VFRAHIATLLVIAAVEFATAQDVEIDLLSGRNPGTSHLATDSISSVREIRQAGWHNPAATDCCESVLRENCRDLCVGQMPIRFRFGIPAWLPETHGDVSVRGMQAPVDVTTRELFQAVDDLNFIVAGRMEAEAGRWGLLVDGGYLNMSENRTILGNRVDVSAVFEQAIVDAALTYDLQEAVYEDGVPVSTTAEVLAGARYWLLGADNVTLTGPRGNSVSSSGTRQWVDPIIGGRIARPLTDSLLMRLRADIGGFGAASDFTWNI
jgi:hypothetical protein